MRLLSLYGGLLCALSATGCGKGEIANAAGSGIGTGGDPAETPSGAGGDGNDTANNTVPGATGGQPAADGGSLTGSGGDSQVTPPANCDVTQAPNQAACLLSSTYSVFVAAGAKGTAGTPEDPVGSIREGIRMATKSGLARVIVCNGDYAETLEMDRIGASLYGGFTCAGGRWAYDGQSRVHVAPPAPGTVLRIGHLGAKVTVADMDFTAADAVRPGDASLAVVVTDSTDVTLQRVTVTAGRGAAGTPGQDGRKAADGMPITEQQQGKAAMCIAAPSEQPGGAWTGENATCDTAGGPGGTAYHDRSGEGGVAGLPIRIDNHGFGATIALETGGDGSDGTDGDSGQVGAAAKPRGTFTAAGFLAADGNDGTDGSPGQGGGGGGASRGSSLCVGASGGAGGQGGCGGFHGGAGGGGGASVALLAWNSTVTLTDAKLVAVDGGDGGKGGSASLGGTGGEGARGGFGDPLNFIAAGGRGGNGGVGGVGGSGSGGTGGPSYALVTYGGVVTRSGSMSLVFGKGGAKGKGGVLTSSNIAAPDGRDGDAGERLILQ